MRDPVRPRPATQDAGKIGSMTCGEGGIGRGVSPYGADAVGMLIGSAGMGLSTIAPPRFDLRHYGAGFARKAGSPTEGPCVAVGGADSSPYCRNPTAAYRVDPADPRARPLRSCRRSRQLALD